MNRNETEPIWNLKKMGEVEPKPQWNRTELKSSSIICYKWGEPQWNRTDFELEEDREDGTETEPTGTELKPNRIGWNQTEKLEIQLNHLPLTQSTR